MQNKTIDYKLFFAIFSLIIFWTIMISSVSVYSSYILTWGTSNSSFLLKNIIHIIIASTLMVILAKIPVGIIKKYSKVIFAFAILWLIAVLIFGIRIKWAKWWLDIPWIPFSLQPAEFAKLWIITFLAYIFSMKKGLMSTFEGGFLPFIIPTWIIIGLLWMQPDFGSVLVILPVATIMFFYAKGNVKHLSLLILFWFILLSWVYFAWKYDKNAVNAWLSERPVLGYIYDRINSFLDKDDDSKGAGVKYQQEQSVIAIGSWWLTWVGFGSSVQKFWYLPEVQWDFIFAVIAEELGFTWILMLISMYLYIWFRCLEIARTSNDPFVKYFAIWFGSRILIQAFVNMWVNLNVLPNTGITLPFVSYGGSSLLSLLMWVWILLNLSRDSDDTMPSNWRKRGFSNKKLYMFWE